MFLPESIMLTCTFSSLALCELNLCLTALALRVLPNMRLFETNDEDVAYDHDMFIPVAKEGTNGVRVKMV